MITTEHFFVFSVRLSVKDQTHGKAWGRLVWRGRPKAQDEKIGGVLKKQWRMVQKPNYKTFSATPEDLNALIDAQRAKHESEALIRAAESSVETAAE